MAGECVHCGIISEEVDIIGIQVKDARYHQVGKDHEEAFSGINSAVIEGLNNKIRTAFKRSYGFKA